MNISNIYQGDSNDTIESDDPKNSDTSDSDTIYDTDDEIDNEPVVVNLSPIQEQTFVPGQPVKMNMSNNQQSSYLPLCIMLNARSIYNKCEHFKDLYQLGPDFIIASETWERKRKRLTEIIGTSQYKTISYHREGNRVGGGCAIIYNDVRFKVDSLEVEVASGVEAVWALFTPKASTTMSKVKRIAVGSFYVSPRSPHKTATIDHIIETIHLLRSKYDNEVNFLLGGDFNRLDISSILDSYGALKQCVTIPTRNQAILEIVLSDISNMFHPPTTLPPLQVDFDKKGSDSDHNIVVFAPLNNAKYKLNRKKKCIKIRPLPESQIVKFENDMINSDWSTVLGCVNVDEKVNNFHNFLCSTLDKHFPEKEIKISSLDKKWMGPKLKLLHRRVQREYFRNRRSTKWKQMKVRFKREKRKAIKTFYSIFVSELKMTNPGKWYQMAKRIGAVDQMNNGDVLVESLQHLDNSKCAQEIAEYYAKISNEFSPVDPTHLPCYLPAQQPPQVEEHIVYQRLNSLKKTRSTLPIDIPDKLRRACSVELSGPLSDIINTSLTQAQYPKLWKQEWVTPAPKVTNPKVIKDLRKISCTSDYSKLYEGFLKDWVTEDIYNNLDIGQFGGRKGTGTEHMIVCILDRILKLLDTHPDKSAVIAASLDWTAAFDRQDPTLAIKTFIDMGVRPSLIPLLISYLSDRKMKVRFNGEESDFLDLVGGGPQGTLLGQIEYLVMSNDNADIVSADDRFKYIDDLTLLQLVCLSGLLTDYNFKEHVASDIGVGQSFLPADRFQTQDHLNYVSNWTNENLMVLNEDKCNYMVFSRAQEEFVTRLTLNNCKLDQIPVTKILGIWVSQDLSWDKNTKEMCKRAYSRVSMLTKLKYVGVSTEDLIDVYTLFIRSVTEYCAVAFHSTLTVEQATDIERIQKTCLKVILGESYVSYSAALEMCGLQTLHDRREKRCLDFAVKCVKHPLNQRLFPLNKNLENTNNEVRNRETFQVNFARTEKYRMSAIPYCQRKLNEYFKTT